MDTLTLDGKSFKGYTIPTPKASLLIISAERGMLACGYIKTETADKIGDAVAIVTGVSSYDDMLKKQVVAVSKSAAEMGVTEGMSGFDALIKMS